LAEGTIAVISRSRRDSRPGATPANIRSRVPMLLKPSRSRDLVSHNLSPCQARLGTNFFIVVVYFSQLLSENTFRRRQWWNPLRATSRWGPGGFNRCKCLAPVEHRASSNPGPRSVSADVNSGALVLFLVDGWRGGGHAGRRQRERPLHLRRSGRKRRCGLNRVLWRALQPSARNLGGLSFGGGWRLNIHEADLVYSGVRG